MCVQVVAGKQQGTPNREGKCSGKLGVRLGATALAASCTWLVICALMQRLILFVGRTTDYDPDCTHDGHTPCLTVQPVGEHGEVQ